MSASSTMETDCKSEHNCTADSAGEWRLLCTLANGIERGDVEATAELYRTVSSGLRLYFARRLQCSADASDCTHDVFLIVVRAIQNGVVREPERLMGFIRTVAQRRASLAIAKRIQERQSDASDEVRSNTPDDHPDPEQMFLNLEKVAVMKQVLEVMQARDRCILTRFYLHEQRPEKICDEMNLTETQFRLLKSRAKSRFVELMQKRVADQRGFKLLRKVRLGVTRLAASLKHGQTGS